MLPEQALLYTLRSTQHVRHYILFLQFVQDFMACTFIQNISQVFYAGHTEDLIKLHNISAIAPRSVFGTGYKEDRRPLVRLFDALPLRHEAYHRKKIPVHGVRGMKPA